MAREGVPPEERVCYVPCDPSDLDGPQPTYGTEGLDESEGREVESHFAEKARQRAALEAANPIRRGPAIARFGPT